MKEPVILTINPGSTSTKVAIFKGNTPLNEIVIRHSAEELNKFNSIADQFEFRKNIITKSIENEGFKLTDIDLIVGRGGLVKSISSGVYEVNDALKKDLKIGVQGEHASNLGGLIAAAIALDCGVGVKAYIADPVVVDEMSDIAHVGGNSLFPRKSIFHALNQKAVCRLYAKSKGVAYDSMNLVVAHMGGGVSVGAHDHGKVVDVNQALGGDGAFSPERSGTLDAIEIVNKCFSGEYTKEQVTKMLVGEGGIYSHLQTTDIKSLVDKAQSGDTMCKKIIDAFCYNVAKQIGAYAVVFKGNVDAVILTGGIAYSTYICEYIKDHVSFIAPIVVYPGEDEMAALAQNGLMVWSGATSAKKYM